MIADIATMVWKEWRELILQGGGRSRYTWLAFMGVFGVFMPLQFGREWVTEPISLVYWAWIPLFLVISVIADAFAGERERHTLETLLASRLSDRAILFGKILAAVGYGWGLTIISLLIGVITVNVANPDQGFLMYPPNISLGILGLSLLGAGLASGAGVLISLRASTVRQAQQTLSLAVMALLFVPILGFRALPAEWQAQILRTLSEADVNSIMLGVGGVLTLLVLGLFAACLAHFQRAKMAFD